MEKLAKKRSCLQKISTQGESLSPLCPLQLSGGSGQGSLEFHPRAADRDPALLITSSASKGIPLLLTELKHAIGKIIMKGRRDIFKFQPNQALRGQEVKGRKPPAVCAVPASGS